MATAIQPETGDLIEQAQRIVNQALDALVITAARDAGVCGCPGCRAKAADAAQWRAQMGSVEEAA